MNRKGQTTRLVKGKRTIEQTTIYKTLHRKLKIEQHKSHSKPWLNSGAPEGQAVLAPHHVTLVENSHFYLVTIDILYNSWVRFPSYDITTHLPFSLSPVKVEKFSWWSSAMDIFTWTKGSLTLPFGTSNLNFTGRTHSHMFGFLQNI